MHRPFKYFPESKCTASEEALRVRALTNHRRVAGQFGHGGNLSTSSAQEASRTLKVLESIMLRYLHTHTLTQPPVTLLHLSWLPALLI
jgi:hypothetical protein